ncbi:hypothetical protein [Alkalicoccobacillus gibsonii]|uniref:hypothetical protein n=1 Tax=Alkalicoccobacillus gibsonii TaxID=79881 RepID=UPI0035196EAE
MTDYRKRMFRGAKIEDCIQEFIQMERTTKMQMKNDERDFALLSKGMNSAYQYVVNRMVREFEYNEEGIELKNQLFQLEKQYRKLSENNLEQSKKNLFETLKESYYLENIPDEELTDLENMSTDNQKGLFVGMSMAYEQVANYISIIINRSDNLSEQDINHLLSLIEANAFMKASDEELIEDAETYQNGLMNGIKAAYGLAMMEIKETFHHR